MYFYNEIHNIGYPIFSITHKHTHTHKRLYFSEALVLSQLRHLSIHWRTIWFNKLFSILNSLFLSIKEQTHDWVKNLPIFLHLNRINKQKNLAKVGQRPAKECWANRFIFVQFFLQKPKIFLVFFEGKCKYTVDICLQINGRTLYLAESCAVWRTPKLFNYWHKEPLFLRCHANISLFALLGLRFIDMIYENKCSIGYFCVIEGEWLR